LWTRPGRFFHRQTCLPGRSIYWRKMKKRRQRSPRLLKLRRIYTMREIAEVLHIHTRTVQTWHSNGMTPINPGDRPLLFSGEDVRLFARSRRNERKCPLQSSEFYCPKCRTATESQSGKLRVEFPGHRMGPENELALIKGRCPSCRTTLTRFATRNSLKGSIWETMISGMHERLWGTSVNPVNTDLGME